MMPVFLQGCMGHRREIFNVSTLPIEAMELMAKNPSRIKLKVVSDRYVPLL